jgi:hypothetical protein
MYSDSFQDPSSAVCVYVFKQIRYNDITEECTIICSPFGDIEQTVDSVDRPNNRNWAFFRVNSLFDFFLELHFWTGPRLIDEGSRNKTTIHRRL